ncbi:MAG: serine-type D-Ala-D-Ala carboxypeptidase [candidate division Zixibacteria bacterium]|nr:serine-type D-Ala-D-Ala carboxypeptidase [candidate division Zixibacteria bacterium]
MRQKGLILAAVFFVTTLWLQSTSHVWCQTQLHLTIQSESAVLMDGITGQILFQKNPEKRVSPASLVKMMTLYLAFDAIKRGNVKFDQEEVVSRKTWKMGGSQMFLEVGDKVKFIELIRGVASISANDGAVAIAEFLTGAEEVFVHLMNEKAKALGLKHTRFVNAHGLHAEGQETSAIDMAHLGFHYIHDHPDALKFHSLPEFTYRGIKQKNWNPLLNRGVGVDGLKTGYLRRTGYHILFSAKRDNQRLIGVVMGARNGESRDSDALKLIKYGFKNFSTLTLVKKGEVVGKAAVPRGDPPEVDLSAARTLIVTVRKDMEKSIPLKKEIPSAVNPPITRGKVLGKLVLEGQGFSREEVDLVASREVLVKSYTTYYVIGSCALVGFLAFFFWRRRLPRKKRKRRRR